MMYDLYQCQTNPKRKLRVIEFAGLLSVEILDGSEYVASVDLDKEQATLLGTRLFKTFHQETPEDRDQNQRRTK